MKTSVVQSLVMAGLCAALLVGVGGCRGDSGSGTPAAGSAASGGSTSSAGGGPTATGSSTAPWPDPLIEEFRATERTCIQRFNNALREQRENSMDELELSNTIERDVLEPWRALRTKVTAAPVPPGREDMYATLRRYMEARQISWEAYEAGLRSPSDADARPHYEMHRTKNAEAQDEAKHLGQLFRDLSK